ncbi:translocation/assembly module TamB domain-containing protein [Reyranella massiliensis]|uniref:translocation/assembly module TamB domain-containing protein n=1 Tax=Reyranella massiliensis TaxID=445220 RepID=UPI0002D41D34|nr:translocation/assembly module TamB domain-containing protein [Reyranella massiliensis]
MRIVRLLSWTFGGLFAVLVVLFAALQTGPVQRSLASIVSDLASTPDSRLSLQGLSGFIPTDLKIERVELADRQGPWLTIEDAEVRWSFLSLLSGRVHVDVVAARRIDVARAPEPAKTEAGSTKAGGSLQLPVGIDLQALSIDELHIGTALAQVDSRWKIAGDAVLPASLADGRLKLEGNRLDGPMGRLGADIRFDANTQAVSGEVTFDEGKGGVVAALLERPDIEGFTTRLAVRGDAHTGSADLTLSAADAATATGKASWQPRDAATEITLRLDTAGPGLPKGPVTDAIRGPMTLTATAALDDKLVTLREARLDLGPVGVTASGRYERAADRLQGSISVEASEPGPFGPLLAGATWRGLKLEAKADLGALATRPQGMLLLTGGAEDISVTAIDARFPALGKVVLDARVGVRDKTLTVELLDVVSSPAAVKGTGTYVTTTERGEGKVTLTVPSLTPFSALAGRDLTGRADLDLTATSDKGDLTLAWQGALRDLGAPGLPHDLVASPVSLDGTASLKHDETWSLRAVRIATEGGAFTVDGNGRGSTGTLDLSLDLPKLAALRADVAGGASAKATITLRGDGTDIKLDAALRELAYQQLKAQKLDLSATASLDSSGAVRGAVEASGDVASQALTLNGRFERNATGGIIVPSFQGRWASAILDVADLAVTQARTTGHAKLSMARLQDLSPLIGTEIAGSLNAEVTADPASPAGRLDVRVQGADIRSGGIAVGTVDLAGTIDDPTGNARTDLTVTASRLVGASGVNGVTATAKGDRQGLDVTMQATGSTAANLAARLEMAADEILVALQRFDGRYDRVPLALAAPTRIHIAGERIRIDPTSMRLGGGRLSTSGTLDPVASDLQLEVAALPLSLIEAFAPGTNLEGTLNTRLRVQGPMAAPRVEATYNAAGVRLRMPDTALVPPLALRGTASLVGQQAALDARITAGGSTNLTLKGQATLPQGRAPLAATATVGGSVDIAPFAPLLGNNIRGVTGTVRPNLSFDIAGSRVTGSGTVDLSNGALALPEAGLRLSGGEARLALQGDVLQIQRFTFQTGRNGSVTASGTVRLDPDQGPVLDLSVGSQRALLVSRPDLVATISSNLKIAGSTTSGIDVSGPITIDRAEIAVGAAQSIDFPTLQVREINRPGAAPPPPVDLNKPKKAAPPPGAAPIRLALTISAPQAIFVRGRGLDAEMSGQFQVSGTPSAPEAIGGLTMRRGEFTLGGRRLNFTRGVVTLDNLDTIDPALDFVASTSVQQTTITVTVSGTSRAPAIAISSSPSLPADEAMALLIFGKPASSLSAFELVQVAAAVAELTGQSPGSSFMSRLRRGLGLDRLSVGSSGGAGGSGGSPVSIEAGRYVAPGIYVGAKQGASGNSSRGVVQIDIFDNVKLEGDIGADSTGRVGAKMEWDY